MEENLHPVNTIKMITLINLMILKLNYKKNFSIFEISK